MQEISLANSPSANKRKNGLKFLLMNKAVIIPRFCSFGNGKEIFISQIFTIGQQTGL